MPTKAANTAQPISNASQLTRWIVIVLGQTYKIKTSIALSILHFLSHM
jgi:hypothetical protein